MKRWLTEKSTGRFEDDTLAYRALKRITTVVDRRNAELPEVLEADYIADRHALGL